MILRTFDRPDLFEEKFLQLEIGRRSRGGSSGSSNFGINVGNGGEQTLRASEANKLLEASSSIEDEELTNTEENDSNLLNTNHKRVDSNSASSISETKDARGGEMNHSNSSHPPNSSTNPSRTIPRRTSAASLRPSILRRTSNASTDQRNKRPQSPAGLIGSNSNRSVSPALGTTSSNQKLRNGSISQSKDTHFYETQLSFGDKITAIRIPTSGFPEEVGDVSL